MRDAVAEADAYIETAKVPDKFSQAPQVPASEEKAATAADGAAVEADSEETKTDTKPKPGSRPSTAGGTTAGAKRRTTPVTAAIPPTLAHSRYGQKSRRWSMRGLKATHVTNSTLPPLRWVTDPALSPELRQKRMRQDAMLYHMNFLSPDPSLYA